MPHDIESILAKAPVLAEINGKRAVADNRVQRCT
jgi:hypothetical protein